MKKQQITITPMRTAGTQHLIERVNRESAAFQWVRETLLNALEAKATHVEFGIEWQAVKQQGVYRRMIADNGEGMTPEQLVSFFNTFGMGGKQIGGVHENFGVGAKTSLLPWNRLGLVVISWREGKPAMIWMKRDEATGEYGMRVLPAKSGKREVLETVFTPFDDKEWGVDWSKVKPAFIKDHGTCVILLGNDPQQHTILGDPYKAEADIKGISSYLNHRIWDMPATGARVFVTEMRTQDKAQWPKKFSDSKDSRVNQREVMGAKHWIHYDNKPKGRLAAHGEVTYSDNVTNLDWFLAEGERPAIHSYAPMNGFIAVLYKNELYNFSDHHATYRSFGITERSVRSSVWIIIRPPNVDPDKGGVYPRTDRSALLYKPRGQGNAAREVPLLDWAAHFADNLPEAIQAAITKARGATTGSLEDEGYRQRLAERFGSRWKVERYKSDATDGKLLKLALVETPPGAGDVEPEESDDTDESDELTIESARPSPMEEDTRGGDTKGTPSKRGGGIPRYRWVPGTEFEMGMLAAWAPHDVESPEGVVLLNSDHPMVKKQTEYWQERYPEHYADEVADEIRMVYGQVAVAKIAHSEHFKGIIPASIVEQDLRSEAALTMSLLGLIAEEAILQDRLDARLKKPKSRVS
jgi:hypothetical protein